MRVDAIRAEIVRMVHQAPFRPFVLSMENGDRITIGHPENIAFDPEGDSPDFYVISAAFDFRHLRRRLERRDSRLGGAPRLPMNGRCHLIAPSRAVGNQPSGSRGDIHRIGGGTVKNLRLKPTETKLGPPGISVLKGSSPADAAEPDENGVPERHETARVGENSGIGELKTCIRGAGFDVMANPTTKFPNHHRIILPERRRGLR